MEKTTLGRGKGKQILSSMKLPVMFRSWQWWAVQLNINSLHSLFHALWNGTNFFFFFLFKYLVITSLTLSSVCLCCSHFSLCCTWKPGVYRLSGEQWNEQLTVAQPGVLWSAMYFTVKTPGQNTAKLTGFHWQGF